jgi:putative cell wall-binding protein
LERIAGSDRYDTAAKLAAFATRPDSVFIATGLGFADALAGAAAAGSQGVPLLLTDRNTVPGPTSTKLAAFSPNPTRCVVLGGTGVITDYVSAQLRLAAG